ncbi:sugar isomerase [Diplodia corticola]|uniref:Sugar isomerase n=1 Tax=Diplodia corticola TaxID=236234 RepID=A0A1J9RQZ5_9PEZI|nr:sugar isomerase [Diplodia corticola]OJD30324.1 sugar isomerase [Diplodia corticola]
MSATSPLEPFGSPKSTNSDESSSSTFDEAASTAASSTTCADDTSATSATPPSSEFDSATHNSLKRKRRSSSAHLDDDDDDADAAALQTTPFLSRALHVLSTEAAALAHITRLYTTSPAAQASLLAAVRIVARAHRRGGKLVVCGVGKSGLVGRKTVATLKSLGVGASFLHAAEAVHGDLGDVRPGADAVMFVSYSGRTAELLNVLPHVPAGVPVVALTAWEEGERGCPLLAGREEAVLLPAPVHESEERSFGVAAPTTSTTVAMAVGDMLALTAAERIHEGEKGRVFKRNHPGGAIGARTLEEEVTTIVEMATTKTKKVCRAGGVVC